MEPDSTTVYKQALSLSPRNTTSSSVTSHDGGRIPRRHVEDVGLAQQVLRDPRVELDHVRDAAHGRRGDLEPLRRHQPVDALAAGRRRQGARVAVCVFWSAPRHGSTWGRECGGWKRQRERERRELTLENSPSSTPRRTRRRRAARRRRSWTPAPRPRRPARKRPREGATLWRRSRAAPRMP